MNSNARLKELDRYDVLDTQPEESFDRIARLAAKFFDCPMGYISFVDGHRQWFKSRVTPGPNQIARETGFCKVTMAQGKTLLVEDLTQDERFRDNALVTPADGMRFYAGAPVRGDGGEVIGSVCVIDNKPRQIEKDEAAALYDFAKMVESEIQLRVTAFKDPLTGALPRLAFQAEASRAISLATRYKYDLSCLVFDIDRMSVINMDRGFRVGDIVLKQTADLVTTTVRTSDILGRVGGEEFAIILPQASPLEAQKLADKLRGLIGDHIYKYDDTYLQVTASFGVAALHTGAMDSKMLVERADTAMCQAKAAGRNRTIVFQGEKAEGAALTRRVLKAGSVVFNKGGSVIDCTVRRLSEKGCAMDVIATVAIPREFELNIPADNFLKKCVMTNKTETSVEAIFAGD